MASRPKDVTSSVRPDGPVAAKAGTYYRNARYIMVTLMLFGGAYFLYDGFYSYPEQNRKQIEKARTENKTEMFDAEGKFIGAPERGDLDILLQRVIGFALLPLGVGYFAYFMRRSRGTIRLDETDTLHVPGHPPVKLAEVTAIDKKLWDRKGIAVVDYTTAGGKGGSITLDDFVYERTPIDVIYYKALLTVLFSAPESRPTFDAAVALGTRLEKSYKTVHGMRFELAHRLLTSTKFNREGMDKLKNTLSPEDVDALLPAIDLVNAHLESTVAQRTANSNA